MSDLNILSQRVEVGSQAVEYTEHRFEIIKRKKHTLRIRIKNDAYKFQSFGVVEVWTKKEEWSEVASIRGEALRLREGLVYRLPASDREQIALFGMDRSRLLKLALEVLS